MKKIFAIILSLMFLISGCSLIPSAKKNDSLHKDEVEDSIEIVAEDEPTEDTQIDDQDTPSSDDESDSSEPKEEAELLEDDNKIEPEEKKEEEPKEKETPKKPLPYRIQVDVTNQVVTVFGRDETGKYTKVARQMIATTGAAATPTPLGTFKMPGQKGRWGYFTKFDVYAQYWNRIKGGILFHSVLFQKQDESTLSLTSVRNLGTPASHGCIRLTVADAKWLYDNIPAGTEVEVMKGKSNPELKKKLKQQVPAHKATKLVLDPAKDIAINVGQEQTLKLNATFDNTTVKDVSKEATWTLSNPQIATIKDGILTGTAPGSAELTGKYENLTVKVKVTVTEIPKPTPTLTVSPASVTLDVGQSKSVGLIYNDGTEQNVVDKAEWKSSNESVAVVNKGAIQAIGSGEAEVTTTYNGLTARVKVVVNKKAEEPKPEEPKPEEPKVKSITIKSGENMVLNVNEEKSLEVNVTLDNNEQITAPEGVTWKSNDANILTVSSNGTIKGIAAGTAELTATFKGMSTTIIITVNQSQNQ